MVRCLLETETVPTKEKILPIDAGKATRYKARSMITVSNNIPPPVRRPIVKRITAELRAMKPGESALFPDRPAAVAFVSWARTQRWKTATKKEQGGVRAWRVE